MQTYLMKLIHTKNLYARIFLAELLATFLLVSCGVGAVAQNKFNVTENPQLASSLSIALAFGFGAGVGIICCGKVSGPAINPAVSFCSFLNGRITLQTMLCAWLGQFVGAFLGAIAVFFAYYDSIHGFRNGMYSMEMAGIFSAYPQPQLSIVGALWDSTMGTMFLCILVHAINDKKNEKSCVFNNSMLVSIVIVIIICSYGYNGGAMINPARDLAPRLFTLIAGWGPRTFTTTHTGIENFWWIPVVGPLFGATFATLLYDICISNNWPAQ